MFKRKDSSSIHLFMVHVPSLLCEFYGECNLKAGIVYDHKSLSTMFFLPKPCYIAVMGNPRSNSLKHLQNYGLEGSFSFLGPGATWQVLCQFLGPILGAFDHTPPTSMCFGRIPSL